MSPRSNTARGDYDTAIRKLSDLLNRHPTYPHAHFSLGNAYLGKSMFAQAVESHRQAVGETAGAALNRAALAHALARRGTPQDKAEAQAIMVELQNRSESEYVSGTALAIGYVGLGQTSAAFDAMKEALRQRDVGLPYHLRAPLFDAIREHPQYLELVAQMNVQP